MKRSRLATDFSVGFVLFVATLIVIVGLFVVGDGKSIFSQRVKYEVLFPNASGLQSGARVKLGGIPVGAVSRIGFPEDLGSTEALVTLEIDRDYRERIRRNSYAWVETQGLMGDAEVHIQMGTADEPVLTGRLPSKPRSPLEGLAGTEITRSAEDLMSGLLAILKEIQEGKGTVGQLLKNPELYESLNTFTRTMEQTTKEFQVVIKDLGALAADIKTQKGTLGRLILSEDYARRFEAALDEVGGLLKSARGLAEDLHAGKGSVGKLLADASLHDAAVKAIEDVARAGARIDGLLAKAEESGSVLGRLALDGEMGNHTKGLIARLERSAASLEKVLAMIEEGEGSLGMLVHDPSIAASIRDVFLGVKEMGLVQGVVRNAERAGREAYLRDVSFAAREAEEVRRARALARIEAEKGAGERSPADKDAEGKPQPASAREGDGRDAPRKPEE
jgi:phospholipid/cholesterol/gamma-HCH transport system substrate-binding protein